MLIPGRLPAKEAEHDAVQRLIEEHEGEPVSLTRRDPGEEGPLLVHVGDKTWEISETGKRKKVT